MVINPKFLKILALSYIVKTLVVGLAWLAVPDLPQRAMSKARQAWSRMSGSTPAAR
jgi:hypothetical protein